MRIGHKLTAVALAQGLVFGCGEHGPGTTASGPVGLAPAALRGVNNYALKRAAFVLVDTGAGVNLTPEDARVRLLGPAPPNDPSLKANLLENSYGTQDLDGVVVGPLQFPTTTCNTAQMASMLKPMVMSAGGGAFNHYIWYMGQPNPACSWEVLAEIGTPDRPSDDFFVNAQSRCLLLARGLGHNVGMLTAASMNCGTTPFVDQPEEACTSDLDGDPFDGMGSACGHMNGWEKIYNGWAQACNGVRVRATGTFTLVPIELPCDGVQVLQIPMPKVRPFFNGPGQGSVITVVSHYYLELRTGRGLDGALATSVQVRVAEDIRGRAQRGLHTWMLDMNPSTVGPDGLAAGASFTDPAGGVSFTVAELDADHATIAVTLDGGAGDPLCIDGTTVFLPPGPGITSCDGAPATTPGMGGRIGSGGASGLGGRGGPVGRGGSSGTGGTGGAEAGGQGGTGGTSAGGATATGGITATGGTTATGGITATGGTTGSGGITATGGTTATGGALATGGTTGSGGASATGGTTATGGKTGASLGPRNSGSGCKCALATDDGGAAAPGIPPTLTVLAACALVMRRRLRWRRGRDDTGRGQLGPRP